MILLVEDDAATREAMAGALRSSGEEILEAHNGEKALRLLVAHPGIKLVVMEFVLPGVDGFKLMDLIHRRRPGLPIVLVSGYLSQWAGNAIIASSTSGAKFFAIPFRQSSLVKTVQELLTS
jgi:DNA-binding NtrC family response regulator